MKTNRRWLWLGSALAVAAGALVLGVPLRTVLTAAALLACPAVMFLGMGLMGGAQGGCAMDHPPGSRELPRANTAGPAGLPSIPDIESSRELEAPPGHERGDPIAILKWRLARGDISLEEYERLARVISAPHPALRRD